LGINLSKAIIFVLFLLLNGCASLNQEGAPVFDLKENKKMAPALLPHNGMIIVRPGETLYTIAWKYGKDYRDIALANNIPSPYVIYIGQKITLNKKIDLKKEEKKPTTFSSLLIKEPAKGEWGWPTVGKVTVAQKGIDIAGQRGSDIRAAAAGKVVYSGSGLRGYGQLIIIKHNEVYLSAYAHNQRLFVKEGESVNKSQVIAEMGHSDTESVKCYFEIRKNGQPISPLSFLPPVVK